MDSYKKALTEADLGEVIVANGVGVGTSSRDDGLLAPSLSLLCSDGDVIFSMLMPFTNVADLDDVIDQLTAVRTEVYGKR